MAHEPNVKTTLAQRRLIYQLGTTDVCGAKTLAATLAACTVVQPCHSAACPACGLAFQQAAVSLVNLQIRAPAHEIRSRMTALTIVPAIGCLAPDDLTIEPYKRVGTEVSAALAVLELPPAIIGLEVSFNEDATGKVEPHWCAHAHGIGYDWLSNAQERSLRAAFPPSRLVKRPVLCVPLDSNEQGSRYPFKPERVRRVTQLKTDHPHRLPYRISKRRELRPWQAVSLALVEHQLGFSGRLLTHGINEQAVRQHLEGLGWARDGP